MQPNGCRSCKRVEEKPTGVCCHGRDQEVELMVWAASLRGTVAEEAKEEEENGRGCREERERFMVVLGGPLVASCGGVDGGKTSDKGGCG